MAGTERIRIFVASPGDVEEERQLARRVILRLRERYRNRFDVEPVLWEYQPIRPGEQVQSQLPPLAEMDAVIVILWSRLGTPLYPESLRGPLSQKVVTGTEYEFEAAMRAREEAAARKDQRLRPDVMVWRRVSSAPITVHDSQRRAEQMAQVEAVQRFFAERFGVGAKGESNLFDYSNYESPAEFEDRLTEHLSAVIERVAGGTARWTQGNPYRGLFSFEPEHAPIFFGRRRAVRELCGKLAARLDEGEPIVVVTGGSGSGKSSLVKAGLVPELEAGFAIGRLGFVRRAIVDLRDVAHDPLRVLAAKITDSLASGAGDGDLATLLASTPELAAAWIQERLRAGATKAGIDSGARAGLIIVLDQFEQAFQVGWSDATRTQFVETLRRLVRASCAPGQPADAPPILVALTLRSDYLHRLDETPTLSECDDRGLYYLGAPSDAELKELIESPAAMAGARFEIAQDGTLLSERLLDGVRSQGEALPLLSFALAALWDQRDGGERLTFAAYERIGGLEGAIVGTAEKVSSQLGGAAIDGVLTRILCALAALPTSVGPTDDDASQRVIARTAPLATIAKSAIEEQIVRAFVETRLLVVTDGDPARGTDVPCVRVVHEALLRSWEFGRTAIARHARDVMLRDRVSALVDTRTPFGEKRHLEGGWLDDAVALLESPAVTLEEPVRSFVLESQRAAIAHRRRAIRRAKQLSAAFAMIAMVAGVAGWFAWRGRVEAERLQRSISVRAILETARRFTARDPSTAARYLRELPPSEWDTRADETAREILSSPPSRTLVGHLGGINAVAFSPDGSRVVTGSDDTTACIWNADGSGEPVELWGLRRGIKAVAFSPDGSHVVTASDDKTAYIWNADGSGEPFALGEYGYRTGAIAFSPDGSRVVTASDDGTARIWNADGSGEPVVLAGHKDSINAVAFSPDGSRVVTASDDETARIWNADGSGEPVVLRGHDGRITAVAFSPDGSRVVTASWDQTARIWNADGSDELVALRAHEDEINAVAFSPDGSRVVTASDDKTARIWNTDGSGEPVVLRGHEGGIEAVAFSPDGSRVVTASDDTTARIWNTDGSGEPLVLRGQEGGTYAVAISPDGSRVVTASWDETARIWNSFGSGEPLVLSGHVEAISAVAFSPDGSRFVTASYDKIARIWNADGSGEPVVLAGHKDSINAVAFSPDGSRVVTASDDETARIWNADGSGEPVVLAGHKDWINAVAFSPDGSRVVTGSWDQTARIWNADGSHEPLVLNGHKSGIAVVAFSPDGSRVATASWDGTTRIWNTVGTGEPLLLSGHVEEISAVAFSPDGSSLVTASMDGTACVWNADGSGEPVVFSGHGDGINAVAFSPDGSRVLTGSDDNTARVWNADGTGEPLVLRGHKGLINDVAFSPDGSRVVTASEDRTARIWTLNLRPLLLKLYPDRPSYEERKKMLGFEPLLQSLDE